MTPRLTGYVTIAPHDRNPVDTPVEILDVSAAEGRVTVLYGDGVVRTVRDVDLRGVKVVPDPSEKLLRSIAASLEKLRPAK